ncbi:serine hydrolase domain-containing protein [Vulgatibacter sp.]|uniref:serine hydrolase domain-containing protein n=1 Tax=Vulgatibacter sp. TaxID=1971226 RepID=UPI00356919AD
MRGEGFTCERIERVRSVMAGHVEHGEVPGLVWALHRRGESLVEAVGVQAVGSKVPMRGDTLFRITSMTKPVVAAAALALVEECRLRLDDPVDRFLPELADRRVLRRIDGPLDETVPAVRPITLRDLLTFRMGFGMSMEPSSHWPIEQAARELELCIGPPLPRTRLDADEWIRRLGTLPLMHQPGARWMYNTASDVLGVLLARATGKPLERVLQERIFEPLGMRDTGFHVPNEKLGRFASAYEPNGTGGIRLHDGAEESPWSRPPAFAAGRDGLVSTANDYLAFARMLLDKGRYDGRQLLSRRTVEVMVTDQITPAQKARSPFDPGFWDRNGWGFGVSVITRRDGIAATPGRFGWYGGYGTSWFSDPQEGLAGVLMTQRMLPPEIFEDFEVSAYQALTD